MPDRARAFGIEFDLVDMAGAVRHVLARVDQGDRACRLVITPNVDHVVKLQSDPAFRAAYAAADLVVIDGWPVASALRWFGHAVPCTVPGSDLVPALFDASAARGGISVFLLGAAEGVAERAARAIAQRWPHVRVAGWFSPPMGFTAEHAATQLARERIVASQADVLLVGLGAPRQELWAHAVAPGLPVHMALCIGASIDFLAGEKARAPLWVRRARLEWLHRALTEPGRLVKRYLHDAWVFPRLVLREKWRSSR
jgi:N-acetylglucosaminyldiphosphoundecaprenol N-acetyl-beta-D-mannosaminyltransferase